MRLLVYCAWYLLCAAPLGSADEQTLTRDEQQQRAGRIRMEQVRHERGHFIHVLRPADVTFISDHVGPDGFAAIGFFVGDLYKEEQPLEAARHQNDDELFLG